MVISANHFKAVTNGFEQRSDGLWTHVGHAMFKDRYGMIADFGGSPEGSWGAGFQRNVNIQAPAPRIHNGGYADAQIQITQSTPSEPRIGFHESGSSALALYKQSGSNSQLRVRGNDGADYPLAGAPGSGQALIGSFFSGTGFSSTATTYYVSPVATGAIACTGVLCRIEFTGSMYHSAATGAFYTGLAMDGVGLHHLTLTYQQVAGLPQPQTWIMYYQPPAGTHTFAVGILNATPGTVGFTPNVPAALWVTEQRI